MSPVCATHSTDDDAVETTTRSDAHSAVGGSHRVPVPSPFPWRVMLDYLDVRRIPGREHVRSDIYVRDVPARAASVTAHHDAAAGVLDIDVRGSLETDDALRRVRRLFGLEHFVDVSPALLTDPLLGPRLAACPGLRPLGCWDAFELCVRTLVGQQVSVTAAQTLITRLAERCGAIEPDALARARLDRIGMPTRRVAAIQGFAAAVCAGDVDLDAQWPTLEHQLQHQPGFGPWTRAYLGIRLGRDPDAFPCADVGLQRAAGVRGAKALEALAERWRPWRAYAATYLWMVAPRMAHTGR